MKLTTFILITTLMQVSAASFAQRLTLKEKNVSLVRVIDEIRKQTGYDVIIFTTKFKSNTTIDADFNNAPLDKVMDRVVLGTGLSYSIEDKSVVIQEKEAPSFLERIIDRFANIDVRGRILGEQKNPLPGAMIKVKGTNQRTITNEKGEFYLPEVSDKGVLIIAYVGYASREVKAAAVLGDIELILSDNKLVEVEINAGYYTVKDRERTGSISTITAKQIENQPVTNVLSALSGQMPGVFVQTTNGLPGGNINIQIRGKGSIAAGTNPLYIIDGVPFNATIGNLTSISALSGSSINGLVSPLNVLNPNDIENISILKDADATAIYGSRGSNGVVLITTKKGKAGNSRIDVDFSQSINQAANYPRLLSPEQYLMIRKEAFSNDHIVPSSDPNDDNYAPELTLWSNTPVTNWPKYFLAGTGNITNVNATVSGGAEMTRFSVSTNYRSEESYLPGNNRYQRGGIKASLQHTSANQKFSLQLSNIFNLDNNRMVNPSTSFNFLLPPNYPVYDGSRNFNWDAGSNAVAEINAYSKAATNSLTTNLQLGYRFNKAIEFKLSSGYNQISLKQQQVFPSIALYPGEENYTNFGTNSNQSILIEPQLNYKKEFGSSALNLLLGASYQNTSSRGEFIKASNFTTISLMENMASAKNYQLTNSFVNYKYASVFARINYIFKDKYIFNGSLRRDASSKFGPDYRTGNFGAIGLAWLFGQENFIADYLPFLSYGKLRTSYGITGNDQITDYQYLSTYGNSGYQYQGTTGLAPQRISNANFHWENTRKAEAGLELGFIQNRLLLQVNRYINTSTDQLVLYTLPTLTGFTSYQANLPAKVQNSGWEFELTSKNIEHQNLVWTSTFNITLPKNVLKSFKDLATSSYAKTLVIGEDITRVYGYRFTGLDDQGNALYQTGAGIPSGSPSSATDAYYTMGKQTPDFYGGIGNSITLKNWSVDLFGQFAKQMSRGGLGYNPGAFNYNNYSLVLDRWTPDHTQTQIPRATTSYDYYYSQSSANFFDASYFRIKTVSVAYTFDEQALKKLNLHRLKCYLQAQNVYTLWHRNIPLLDPESGALSSFSNSLPPTKTFSLGIQATF